MEDSEKEKKTKMALAVFTMTCLDFVLDEIKPLGSLHLDVVGWEACALRGAGEARHGENRQSHLDLLLLLRILPIFFPFPPFVF